MDNGETIFAAREQDAERSRPGRARRLARRLRGPSGLVDHTRWLFCLFAFLAWALTTPTVLLSGTAFTRYLAGVACLALTSSWLYQYKSGRAQVWPDVVSALGVLGFALASSSPSLAYGFTFSVLWFRAMYGSTVRFVLYGLGSAAAILLSVALWSSVPGRESSVQPGVESLGPIPLLFIIMAVSRYLALSMFAREQSQRRDAVLSELGTMLLAVGERAEIRRCAGRAVTELCAATGDLRALLGEWDGASMRVIAEAGAVNADSEPGDPFPCADPGAAADPGAESGAGARAGVRRPMVVPDTPELSARAGFRGSWRAIPLPGQPRGWLLLGSSSAISGDVMVAFQSLVNQVALALRNSEARHRMGVQATTDSLTGLMNRAAFTQAVDRALSAEIGPLALLFVDLDDFKIVNDGLGHAAGDELLRQVADRMRQAVREEDACARIGGDEFAILLGGADPVRSRDGSRAGGTPEAAVAVATRLISLIASPVRIGEAQAQVGASIGVGYSLPGISREQLLQRADVAMYAAKAQGKNRVQEFELGLLNTTETATGPRRVAAQGRRALTDSY